MWSDTDGGSDTDGSWVYTDDAGGSDTDDAGGSDTDGGSDIQTMQVGLIQTDHKAGNRTVDCCPTSVGVKMTDCCIYMYLGE